MWSKYISTHWPKCSFLLCRDNWCMRKICSLFVKKQKACLGCGETGKKDDMENFVKCQNYDCEGIAFHVIKYPTNRYVHVVSIPYYSESAHYLTWSNTRLEVQFRFCLIISLHTSCVRDYICDAPAWSSREKSVKNSRLRLIWDVGRGARGCGLLIGAHIKYSPELELFMKN